MGIPDLFSPLELVVQKYRFHHAVGKFMGAKHLGEAIGYTEQLGYPSGPQSLGGGPDDYLYCCPNNLETEVCHHMVDHIGFLKLEAMLSTMSSVDFTNCLAYTLLKVVSIDSVLCFRLNCYKTLLIF
jgi:hypothetical protein